MLVRFEGVVTADLRTGGFNGLYVQTAGSGGAGHAGASTGAFVFLTSNPAFRPDATIGDAVRVTGRVSEFQGLTEVTIGARTDVEVLGSATPLPQPVPLGLPLDTASRESLEGMLVAPTGPYTVTDVFDLGGFGEVGLHAGTSPALSPTEVAEPGAPAQAVRAENLLRTIVLDDGVSTNLFTAGKEPPYLGDAPVRVGDQVSAFSSVVMSFGFGAYRLQPVRPVTADTTVADRTRFAATNPRTATPSVSGELKLGAFNVLNYFTTLRQDLGYTPTDNQCPARGAYDQAEFDVQESKIVAAINALGAEVVTLEEIENSAKLGEPVDEAVATLVAALNEEAGAGTWDYIRSPGNLPDVSLRDFIRNAIIYKPAAVVPQGPSTALGDQSDPGEAFAEAREPIAQAFVPVGGGRPFTVVGNHFKSKGSAAGLPGDEDQGDGQGASNATRTVQAQALRDWVAGLAASTGVEDVFLLGDFNSYSKEDPIDVLTTAGFTSLNSTPELGTGKHSYSFDGESGSLDHILASPSAFVRVSDLDIWSINAVESRAFEYTALRQGLVDSETPYRSSDHDPEIVGIDRGTPPCTTTITGRRLGPLDVTSGTTCLAPGAQVIGVVRVSAGASFVADSASVTGSVIADGAAFVALTGTHITGPVRIASTTGTVTLSGNTVTGAVLLTGNTTPFASVVSGNSVGGLLSCSGNTPPPVNDGVPNTVYGVATGQCRDL